MDWIIDRVTQDNITVTGIDFADVTNWSASKIACGRFWWIQQCGEVLGLEFSWTKTKIQENMFNRYNAYNKDVDVTVWFMTLGQRFSTFIG